MKSVLYLTDLYYQANGRNYYEEDLYITSRLKEHFNILIGNPKQAISFLTCADFIVFRNTGPVIYYQEYFNSFKQAVSEKKIPIFNSLDGKADVKGKQYLLDLTTANFPVIPSIESKNQLQKLGVASKYILKLKNGADSIGMQIVNGDELEKYFKPQMLIQPFIEFEYEVSFYFLNNEFQYALYAPDKEKRWKLTTYTPTTEDLLFAEKFILWNNMQRGISRVDACRLSDGTLLLVELEDLNPFLSLDLLESSTRERFMENLIHALKQI